MVRGSDLARDGVMVQRLECFDTLRMMHCRLLTSFVFSRVYMCGRSLVGRLRPPHSLVAPARESLCCMECHNVMLLWNASTAVGDSSGGLCWLRLLRVLSPDIQLTVMQTRGHPATSVHLSAMSAEILFSPAGPLPFMQQCRTDSARLLDAMLAPIPAGSASPATKAAPTLSGTFVK